MVITGSTLTAYSPMVKTSQTTWDVWKWKSYNATSPFSAPSMSFIPLQLCFLRCCLDTWALWPRAMRCLPCLGCSWDWWMEEWPSCVLCLLRSMWASPTGQWRVRIIIIEILERLLVCQCFKLGFSGKPYPSTAYLHHFSSALTHCNCPSHNSVALLVFRNLDQHDLCGGHCPVCCPGLLHQAVEKPGHGCQLAWRSLLSSLRVSLTICNKCTGCWSYLYQRHIM